MRAFVTALILLGVVGFGAPARAQGIYRIDQHFGGIEFTVRNLGLFDSHGVFDRFMGHLVIDPAHPDRTHIDVDVDANSVSMPWDQGATMLRSEDFFDVTKYPEISFTSSAVRQVSPDHYQIDGQLRIRGVARSQTLDAVLIDRHVDPARGADVADFVVSGKLKRSDFGMVADPGFIADSVGIRIHARIVLDRAAAG
jgi:polyisoprenoid-binding protein YceI